MFRPANSLVWQFSLKIFSYRVKYFIWIFGESLISIGTRIHVLALLSLGICFTQNRTDLENVGKWFLKTGANRCSSRQLTEAKRFFNDGSRISVAWECVCKEDMIQSGETFYVTCQSYNSIFTSKVRQTLYW